MLGDLPPGGFPSKKDTPNLLLCHLQPTNLKKCVVVRVPLCVSPPTQTIQSFSTINYISYTLRLILHMSTSSPDRKKTRLSEDTKMTEIKDVYNPNTSASLAGYHSTHTSSIADISSYWSNLANTKLDWFAPFPEGAAVTGKFCNLLKDMFCRRY